ncbi:TetR/AcrR family transcriptional regulator [Cucumibacter marinus]|uniref:TetR/AcrR family transcriptional regulator n=1 Tax=Cucumibacter marinus TaxID=1121252 RepID=UPI00049026F8|nr:TetR/AcrR family transcriptional regulator [Cucumibacter marinus]
MNDTQQNTRQRIIEAALPLFAEKGFAGASIRAIARNAGIRESSLYNHFISKNDLFSAILTDTGPGVVSRIVAHILSATSRLDFTAAMTRFSSELSQAWRDPRHLQLYLISLREPSVLRETTGEGPAHWVRGAVEALAELLIAYADAGEISLPAEAEYLAWLYLAPLSNLKSTFGSPEASGKDHLRADALTGQHLDFFVSMLTRESKVL